MQPKPVQGFVRTSTGSVLSGNQQWAFEQIQAVTSREAGYVIGDRPPDRHGDWHCGYDCRRDLGNLVYT